MSQMRHTFPRITEFSTYWIGLWLCLRILQVGVKQAVPVPHELKIYVACGNLGCHAVQPSGLLQEPQISGV